MNTITVTYTIYWQLKNYPEYKFTKCKKCYAKHIAIRKLYNTTCYSRGAIGSKTESYATEEEMLNGFTCSVSDLSESEIEIYNGL